ncbi:transcription factor bHLH110 isoform X2 [Henckelia pumila]|uniref:transcription factor bHLH110 isoform X2 n=1 Tax=Henckelia pumila TaxID=405737 RepID=UPI003C6E3629
MESANIHHHQLHEDHLLGSSSSSSSSPSSSSVASLPSSYGFGNNTHLAWIHPASHMSTNGFNSDPLNPRESRQQENTTVFSPQYSSMSPDFGFHWANVTDSSQDLNLSRIKDEISGNYYLKYTDLLSSLPPSSNDYSTFKIEPRNQQDSNDIGKRLLLKSLPTHGDFYSDSQSNYGAVNCGRGFSQIFPSTNVSNPNLTGLTNPGSLDMNLQALDLLNSSRFSGNFNLSFPNQIGLLRDGFCYGIDYLQQSHQAPILYNSNKNISGSISNGAAAETKRNGNKMEAKAVQNAPKKLRSEARASCPPFKVRKEKLGDRISALQQLVAPFGKTDTASVLMEAIGYIKFLQSQVETLSVPYMKCASRNKKSKVLKGRDLKTRGLCLVPLSLLSYITGNGGAPVWPPPHFGGATG